MSLESIHDSTGVNGTVAESQTESAEATLQQTKESSKEYNFRELERRRNEAEARARELELRLIELEKAKQQPQVDEFDSLDDDAIVEAKQLKKLKKEIQELKSQKSMGLSPEDISRIKFKDYDEVVSEQNVEAHLLSNPVLAQMVKSSANPYEAAYHLLKKFHKPAEKAPDLTKKLEEVAAKPRSLNEAAAKTPGLSSSSGSSIADIEMRRQEALKRAQKYLGGYF